MYAPVMFDCMQTSGPLFANSLNSYPNYHYKSKHQYGYTPHSNVKRKSNSKRRSSSVPTAVYDSLVRKIVTVTTVRYAEKGLVVMLDSITQNAMNNRNRDHSETLSRKIDAEIYALLEWSAFCSQVREWNDVERKKIFTDRLPPGSKFNVFVNSVEKGQLFITLAVKPNLSLNYDKPLHSVFSPAKYRYLVIMDFEATCDYSPHPCVDALSAEIIEFPWVVFDTSTLSVIDQHQKYIKPLNVNGITPYCKALTGISEDVVQDGSSLADAVSKFNDYVTSKFPPDSFMILTHGVWDLQVQLQSEAKRKKIPLDTWFAKFFDLKEEFRNFLPMFPFKMRELSLQEMLTALRLNFVGRPHSGLDDSLTIAAVVREMMCRGHEFSSPVQVVDMDTQYNKWILSFSQQSSMAPLGCWRCTHCSSLHGDRVQPPSDDLKLTNANNSNESPQDGRGVWNHPSRSTCKFCASSK